MTDKREQKPPPVRSKTMERRKLRQFKDMLVRNDKDFLREIAQNIKTGDEAMVRGLLEVVDDYKQGEKLASYTENDGETLLHLAVKYQDNPCFAECLIKTCANLICNARESSLPFYGQTALHVAITKGNVDVVRLLVDSMCDEKKIPIQKRIDLLHTCATGKRFVNTVMLGELPLSVAALKDNHDIVDILLDIGVDICKQNHHGDTVFHSLIKYAATYPEKTPMVLNMMRKLNWFIEEKSHEHEAADDFVERSVDDTQVIDYKFHYSYVWFLQNNDNLTPLQLSAKHGLSSIFEFILNIKDVYCIFCTHDGLFDVKQYDISEIDTVCNHKTYQSRKSLAPRQSQKISPDRLEGIAKKQVTVTDDECLPTCHCMHPETESVLEMMYSSEYSSREAFRIIELTPVKNIVKSKWRKYRYLFGLWLFVHFSFMIMYTIFGIERAKKLEGNATTLADVYRGSCDYVCGFQWFALTIGLIYCAISILLVFSKFRRQNWTLYIFHNAEYILPLALFSITIVIDVILTQFLNESICLIIALIFGWWFCVFFLSPFQMFSFFAEMVKRVILGDLLRFGLIITFELIAFTSGMFIVFRGSPVEDQGFENFGDTMLTMFKLGIGLGDIEVLYSARNVWAAVALFILFLIFTYLLMLNALIAMMSQTCALVLQERYPQWRVQQLSVMLLLEDILCVCCFRNYLGGPGREIETRGFDPKTKHRKTYKRYFLEIHSLQMEYATEEEKERVKKKQESQNMNASPIEFNETIIPDTLSSEYDETLVPTHNYMAFNRQTLRPRRMASVVERVQKLARTPSSRKKLSTKPKLSPKSHSLDTLDEELPNDRSDAKGSEGITPVSPKPPDVILSDRSPKPSRIKESKRKRNKSENLHEKDTRNMGIQHSPPPDPEPVSLSAPALHLMARVPNGLIGKPGLEIRDYSEL